MIIGKITNLEVSWKAEDKLTFSEYTRLKSITESYSSMGVLFVAKDVEDLKTRAREFVRDYFPLSSTDYLDVTVAWGSHIPDFPWVYSTNMIQKFTVYA